VRELLIEDITKDVKVDEATVEKLSREIVREWKIKSVFLEKEDDAKKMEEEIKAGKSFDDLVAKAMEDKTAKAVGEGGYVKAGDLQPGIVEVVSKMAIGSVSPVVPVGSDKNAGFTIMKLEDIRYPEDPETTERVRGAVLEAARGKAVRDFKKELLNKTVKINSSPE
jgi:parvulin-like peptidyl-prolyl isomerase